MIKKKTPKEKTTEDVPYPEAKPYPYEEHALHEQTIALTLQIARLEQLVKDQVEEIAKWRGQYEQVAHGWELSDRQRAEYQAKYSTQVTVAQAATSRLEDLEVRFTKMVMRNDQSENYAHVARTQQHDTRKEIDELRRVTKLVMKLLTAALEYN